MNLQPITLEGAHVRLEPLSESHHEGLSAVGLDPELWKWIPIQVLDRDSMMRYIRNVLSEMEKGTSIPFATVERSSGTVVGATRFMNIDVANKRVEIGSTWIAQPWQRSAINTEAKYLMMRYAFRSSRLQPGRAKNRFAEHQIAQRDSAHRREAGGNSAQPHDHLERTPARYGVLQRDRAGMA